MGVEERTVKCIKTLNVARACKEKRKIRIGRKSSSNLSKMFFTNIRGGECLGGGCSITLNKTSKGNKVKVGKWFLGLNLGSYYVFSHFFPYFFVCKVFIHKRE